MAFSLVSLLSWDTELFFSVNHGFSSAWGDIFWPFLRNHRTWVPLYVFLILYWPIKYRAWGIALVAFTLVTFACTDFTTASLIKPLVQRLRPCNDPHYASQVILRLAKGCGSGYSFPSAHASNHFGLAVFWGLVFYPRQRWVLLLGLLWALLIATAQVYVGVHFPLDIMAGALLGTAYAFVVYFLFSWLMKKYPYSLCRKPYV